MLRRKPAAMLPLLLAAGLLLTAGAAQAAAPRLERAPCHGDFGVDSTRVECGVLSVEETRGSGNGRRVAVPVVIVKASQPRPGLPPVIFLHGGPGAGAVERAAGLLRSPLGRELVGVEQDWVIFDQRGGGLSSPALDCGEVAMNDAGPLTPAAVDALAACAVRHRAAGVDLTRYNAVEGAHDIQDLRTALGYARFDVFGGSYGTRIAFTLMRVRPEGLRAAVLDSVWPPEARWADGGPRLVADAVDQVLDRCELDRTCIARFPRLRAEVDALARRFLAGPVMVKERRYTAEDLGGFLMDAAYFDAAALPRDLAKLAAGDMAPLDAHRRDRSPYLEAQHLTHLCKEEFPFETREAVARNAGDDPIARLSVGSFQRYFDVCRAFPVGTADPQEGEPLSSTVPTLFLSPDIDPGTPPAVARAAAARFSRGQIVIAPNTTHGVTSRRACGRALARAFLRDPTARLDTACLNDPEHASLRFDLD